MLRQAPRRRRVRQPRYRYSAATSSVRKKTRYPVTNLRRSRTRSSTNHRSSSRACCHRRWVRFCLGRRCFSYLNGNWLGLCNRGWVALSPRVVCGSRTATSACSQWSSAFIPRTEVSARNDRTPVSLPWPPVLLGRSSCGGGYRRPGSATGRDRHSSSLLLPSCCHPVVRAGPSPGAAALTILPRARSREGSGLAAHERGSVSSLSHRSRCRRDSGPSLVASPPRNSGVHFCDTVVVHAPRAAPAISERRCSPWLRHSGKERSVLGSNPQPPRGRVNRLRAVTASIVQPLRDAEHKPLPCISARSCCAAGRGAPDACG